MPNICQWAVSLLLFSTLFYPHATWAAKAYIVDTKEVPLRTSPNAQAKPIAMLTPGASVEILKGSEWTLVRYSGTDAQPRDGWVPTRTLGARPPEETLTKELQNENAALNERVVQLEKEKVNLQQREQKLSEQFSKLENDYEKLKTGSANYIALRDEYESTQTNLAASQETIERLTQENDSLRLSQRVTWFAAGAFVLFCGWVIGWVTGRHQRKRRIIYF